VLVGVVTSQGVGQRAADNLCEWQRSGEWVKHRDVPQAHQWNGDGAAGGGAARQKGRRRPNDSCFGSREADGCVVGVSRMTTVAAMVLAGEQG